MPEDNTTTLRLSRYLVHHLPFPLMGLPNFCPWVVQNKKQSVSKDDIHHQKECITYVTPRSDENEELVEWVSKIAIGVIADTARFRYFGPDLVHSIGPNGRCGGRGKGGTSNYGGCRRRLLVAGSARSEICHGLYLPTGIIIFEKPSSSIHSRRLVGDFGFRPTQELDS
jgi:hypothetical protein